MRPFLHLASSKCSRGRCFFVIREISDRKRNYFNRCLLYFYFLLQMTADLLLLLVFVFDVGVGVVFVFRSVKDSALILELCSVVRAASLRIVIGCHEMVKIMVMIFRAMFGLVWRGNGNPCVDALVSWQRRATGKKTTTTGGLLFCYLKFCCRL